MLGVLIGASVDSGEFSYLMRVIRSEKHQRIIESGEFIIGLVRSRVMGGQNAILWCLIGDPSHHWSMNHVESQTVVEEVPGAQAFILRLTVQEAYKTAGARQSPNCAVSEG